MEKQGQQLSRTIEVGGLLLIIGISLPYLGTINYLSGKFSRKAVETEA